MGSKSAKYGVIFSTSLNFEPLAFENAARYLNFAINFISSDDRHMSLPSLVKLGPHNPENRSVKLSHPLRLQGENVLNR